MEKKKKTIQDIKPSSRKLVRSSPILVKKTIPKESPSEPVQINTQNNYKQYSVSKSGTSPHNKSMIVWVIAIVSIGALVGAFSTFFVGATVTVIPKSIPFSLDNELFVAEKNATSGLSYQTMSVSGSKTFAVDTKSSTEAASKAEGTVILFNSFSESPVNLLIDTRLESSKGILYKTKTAVKIPGFKKVNGEIVPGTIEADVYADIAGVEGNDEMTDFKVVGFKGTPKETKVYARSKTPMSGGVVGLVYQIPDDEYTSSYESLQRSLNEDLQSKLRAEVPPRFFIVPGSITYKTLSSPTEKYSKEKMITLSEEGSLSAFIIDRGQFSNMIGEKVLQGSGAPYDVIVPEIENLRYSFELNGDSDTPKLSLRVSGENDIVWNIDKEKIAYDLRATHRRQFESIIGSYATISEASLVVQPFWRRTLPEKVSDIKVVNKRFD